MIIETSSKNAKAMPSDALCELNSFKPNKEIKEIKPKKPSRNISCSIFWKEKIDYFGVIFVLIFIFCFFIAQFDFSGSSA